MTALSHVFYALSIDVFWDSSIQLPSGSAADLMKLFFLKNLMKHFVCHRHKGPSYSFSSERETKNFMVPLKTLRIFKIHNENISAGAFQVSTWAGPSIWDARWRLRHYSYVSSTNFLFFWLDHFSYSTYHHSDDLIVVIDTSLSFLLLRLLEQY